jgi:hypothetical protein
MLRRESVHWILVMTASFIVLGCAFSFALNPEATATATVPPTLTPAPPTLASPSPTPTPTDTVTPTVPAPTSTPTLPATSAPVSRVTPGSPSGPYAVILVTPGDVLNIRSAAGVSNPIVGSFAPSAVNVMRTGPSARAGDALWVEVQRPGGGSGWVNFHFLTEYVPSSTFCGDARVTSLLNDLRTALANSNGEALVSLVSPTHGMDVRVWRYGTVVNYDREHARFLFESTFQVNWGPAPGSGENTTGSFSQVVLPKLTEVFGANHERRCNDPMDLATFTLVPWPPEYANVNFYAVYKPGTETYGGLDWRTWLVGIEYIGGRPYLFSMIHFQWEP